MENINLSNNLYEGMNNVVGGVSTPYVGAISNGTDIGCTQTDSGCYDTQHGC